MSKPMPTASDVDVHDDGAAEVTTKKAAKRKSALPLKTKKLRPTGPAKVISKPEGTKRRFKPGVRVRDGAAHASRAVMELRRPSHRPCATSRRSRRRAT